MNICSNQIKEVILHRFKVNSLQKLLIHINILLAFSVLFCSHSAYGQSVEITVPPLDPMVVDMGFTDVYWSKRNLGAEQSTDENNVGNYYKSDAIMVKDDFVSTLPSSYSSLSYWRVPTKKEIETLVDKTQVTISYYNNNSRKGIEIASKVNNNKIFIPISNLQDYPVGNTGIYPNSAFFWSCTKARGIEMVWVFRGYDSTPKAVKWTRLYRLPIRPVINKCKITVKIYEDNVKQNELIEYVPQGTTIALTANGACYNVNWVGDNLNSNNITISRQIYQSETITAYFSTKTTDIVATTEDDQKGTVGILEPINN